MKRISMVALAMMLSITGCQREQTKAEAPAEKGIVEISVASQRMAGIKTAVLALQKLPKTITATGEVIPNADESSIITPKVAAHVVKRYVQVGQKVTQYQPLIRLSSIDVAKAQGDFLTASQDWQRVKQLGKAAVSAKRYQEAEVVAQHAGAKLMAYGMTQAQVDALQQAANPKQATGEFELLAPRSGTLYRADAVEGAMIEPGKILFEIVNGTSLWVDAQLSPQQASTVAPGTLAWIDINKQRLPAKVLQVHPQLDETTRTQTVRLEVPDGKQLLHAGQFVDCRIVIGQTETVLAVPTAALLQTAEGQWVIYVEQKAEHFKQQPVKTLETLGDMTIISGVAPGSRVVTQGAFFVHAELNKGSLEAGHH